MNRLPGPLGIVAILLLHAVFVGAAVSGVLQLPVHAFIMGLGDKGAHLLAGFVLTLPALLMVRRYPRAWVAVAYAAVLILPVAWESPALGLSLVFDPGDVLANLGGVLAATLVSAFLPVVLRLQTGSLAIARTRRAARRFGSAMLATVLLGSSLAVVAAWEGSVMLPNQATRTFPETGYLTLAPGDQLEWNWTSDYINFWWEDLLRGQFGGGDVYGDSGCWDVDVAAFLRLVWANTADPPPGDTVVNYTINVVNGTASGRADCVPLSTALPPSPSPPMVALVAILVSLAFAIPVVAAAFWWDDRQKGRGPPGVAKPPATK